MTTSLGELEVRVVVGAVVQLHYQRPACTRPGPVCLPNVSVLPVASIVREATVASRHGFFDRILGGRAAGDHTR